MTRRIVLSGIVILFMCSALCVISVVPGLIAEIRHPGTMGLDVVDLSVFESAGYAGQVILSVVVLPIVILAALSEGIAHFYILFANRVKPFRFILTMIINMLLFVASFYAAVFSVWLVGNYIYGYDAAVQRGILAVGMSYTPLLLGFLSVLPYFGTHIMKILYFASYILLAEILHQLGYTTVEAFTSAILSLVIVYIMRATIGRPVIWLGRSIRDLAAGTHLEQDVNQLLEYDGNFLVGSGNE